jgi:hypothetical protein
MQRAVLQAEERVEETTDCDGCVVDHWHYLVDDSPECLGQLQGRIGDEPAALVGRPESGQAKYSFRSHTVPLCFLSVEGSNV